MISDDQWWLAMDRVWMDFGFSFDAIATIDMILYSEELMKEDEDGWR